MVVSTLVVVLGLLVLILELRAEYSACYCANDAMAAHLVATKVSGCTSTERAHQSPVTLSLCVGVGRAVVLLSGLGAVGIMALRVLVGLICALLGELVCGLSTRVCSLLLWVLALLVVRRYLLAMLKSSMCWCAVLLVIALLFATVVALSR